LSLQARNCCGEFVAFAAQSPKTVGTPCDHLPYFDGAGEVSFGQRMLDCCLVLASVGVNDRIGRHYWWRLKRMRERVKLCV